MLGIIIFYSYLYNVGQGDQISSTQNTTTMEEEQIMEAHYAPKYGCFSQQYYKETFGDVD